MIFFRFLVLFFLFSGTVYGQVTVNNSVVTNPPVTSCSATFLTVTGIHNYAGYSYTGATVSTVGTTIYVSLNYTFSFGLAVITPFTQNVNIGMIPTGTYTTLVSGSVNGTPYGPFPMPLTSVPCCSSVSSFTSNATDVCVGDLVQLTNTSTGSIGQAWFNDGTPAGSSVDYSFIATSPGPNQISLVVTNGSCFDSTTQTINVLSVPVVDSLHANTSAACIGEFLVLTAYSTGSLGSTGQKWFKNGVQIGTGPIISAIASGVGIQTFSFVATNNYCSDTMDLQLEFFAPPSIDTFDVGPLSICLGETVLCGSATSGATTLTWKVDNVVSGTGSSFSDTPTTQGNYEYSLVASNGVCSDSTSTNVFVMTPAPDPDLGPDSSYCSGTIVLDAGSAVSYLWSDASTGQFLNVTSAGTYWVTTMITSGCTATDTIVFTSCLGIQELNTRVFKIGPNPVHDNLEIQTEASLSEMNISISSAAGKVVFRKKYINEKKVHINTTDFETGFYFVTIESVRGTELIKIVKEY
jgi:hypothetical protein